MGPIWGRQDPGGPHVGPMNFAIWVVGCQSVPDMTFDQKRFPLVLPIYFCTDRDAIKPIIYILMNLHSQLPDIKSYRGDKLNKKVLVEQDFD